MRSLVSFICVCVTLAKSDFFFQFDFRHEESRHSTLCDVHSLLKRTRDETRYDVTVFDSCQRIFYNRVPKCGSRSVLSVFSELAKQNGFQVISLAKSRKYSLTDEDARVRSAFTYHNLLSKFPVWSNPAFPVFKILRCILLDCVITLHARDVATSTPNTLAYRLERKNNPFCP